MFACVFMSRTNRNQFPISLEVVFRSFRQSKVDWLITQSLGMNVGYVSLAVFLLQRASEYTYKECVLIV